MCGNVEIVIKFSMAFRINLLIKQANRMDYTLVQYNMQYMYLICTQYFCIRAGAITRPGSLRSHNSFLTKLILTIPKLLQHSTPILTLFGSSMQG